MTDVGLLDRLLGREDNSRQQTWNQRQAGDQQQDWSRSGPQQRPRTDDETAIERYRYMLRTAPPDQVEQAHAEAFAKLTPEQRRQVLADLSEAVPPGERAQSDDPRSLARMATRAEMRQPGTMERTLGRGGGMGGGIGMGGMIAGGLLASVAGAFVGTAIADAMFDFNDSGESSEAADAGDSGSADGGDYGDGGGLDGGGSDFGGDFGGGDFGGF
jgi:hypothetical protein